MLEIVYKRLEELKPYSNNPRNNEKAIESVMESIKYLDLYNVDYEKLAEGCHFYKDVE